MHRELTDQYSGGADRLAQSIRGLSDEDLASVPPDSAPAAVGKWSIHQVVIHLCDAEMAFGDRIRRIIAEDDPLLLAWDEKRFAERLRYDQQSVADAMTLIALTRRQLTRVLLKLDPADFERAGRHSQRGRQTLGDVIAYASMHLEHHLKFIEAKREWSGKLMW